MKSIPNRLKVTAMGIFILCSAAPALERFQAGGFFVIGSAQNDFGNYLDRTNLGGSLSFAVRLGDSPLFLGVAGDFLVYGYDRTETPFSYTVPDVFVDVVTLNSIWRGHAFLRLQAPSGGIRPYVDGLLGFTHLRTDTSVRDGDAGSETLASTSRSSDSVFSYGIGAGLMFPLRAPHTGGRARGSGVLLDLGARFLKGGQADYLLKNPVWSENDFPLYDEVRSSTDLLSFHMGITFLF